MNFWRGSGQPSAEAMQKKQKEQNEQKEQETLARKRAEQRSLEDKYANSPLTREIIQTIRGGSNNLPEEIVGDALEGFEGKPYSNANLPEEGVIGIGYAMGQEDFEHVLYDVLDYPLGPVLNQDRTTELSCIVVTEDGTSVPAE